MAPPQLGDARERILHVVARLALGVAEEVVGRPLHRVGDVAQRVPERRVLALEVEVEARAGDARLGRDVLDRQLPDRAGLQELLDRIDDGLAAAITLRRAPRLAPERSLR